MTAILTAVHLTRIYGERGSGAEVAAVSDVSVAFEQGLLHTIVGPSGSGKSTLLHLLAGLDRPTSGAIVLAGQDLSRLADKRASQLRQQQTGFVFQRFNLIPSLSAGRNIRLPVDLAGRHVDSGYFKLLVERLGLANLLPRNPAELSGGQQQRVAIARALLHRPAVVFADEPTGSLDTDAARDVTQLLRDLTHETGTTMIVVTHSDLVAEASDRVLRFVDGRVASDLAVPVQRVIGGAAIRHDVVVD